MGRGLGLFLLLLTGIWLGAQIDAAPSGEAVLSAQSVPSPWRRTQRGWEQSNRWGRATDRFRREGDEPPGLPHPGLIALFEALAASFCLLAFESPEIRKRSLGGDTRPKR